jgi:hypothetical protein
LHSCEANDPPSTATRAVPGGVGASGSAPTKPSSLTGPLGKPSARARSGSTANPKNGWITRLLVSRPAASAGPPAGAARTSSSRVASSAPEGPKPVEPASRAPSSSRSSEEANAPSPRRSRRVVGLRPTPLRLRAVRGFRESAPWANRRSRA